MKGQLLSKGRKDHMDISVEPRLAKRVDEHVGERIRERRTLLGLTQEQLAAALQISYQQVQKYETGSNRVSAGRLFEISNVLGVEVGYFFDGLRPHSERRELVHGGRNRILIELVRNFSEIDDPTIRTAVSGLVKALGVTKADELESGAVSQQLGAVAAASEEVGEKSDVCNLGNGGANHASSGEHEHSNGASKKFD